MEPKPIEALAMLERAARAMQLPADEHDKLRSCVQIIFNQLKMIEEETSKKAVEATK